MLAIEHYLICTKPTVVERGVWCSVPSVSMCVCMSVRILQTKPLKIFRPNFVGSY